MIPFSNNLSHIVLVVLYFLGAAVSLPTQNFTIEVPDGTTNHGDPHLLCTPTRWTDIATFFLFNFLAHAATVVSYPGESTLDVILSVVAAILFPTSGAIRGLNAIMRHSVLTTGNDLQRAARSGALCMVVRSTSWKPKIGDVVSDVWVVEAPESESEPETLPLTEGRDTSIRESEGINNVPLMIPQSTAVLSTYIPPWMKETSDWSYTDTQDVYTTSRVVFGSNELPDGYVFAFVPRNTRVLGLVGSSSTSPIVSPPYTLRQSVYRFFRPVKSTSPKLSSSYSVVKAATALFQSMYAFSTLYRSRGDQIRRYGYAAFALTVAPYAVMSVLNLIGNLVTPHYPTLYLVKSEVMEEAERRKKLPFDHVVGRIETFVESDTDDAIEENWLKIAGSFNDNDEQLHVLSPGVKQGEKLIVSATIPNAEPHRTMHVPACPRFQRTDNIQNMKYQQRLCQPRLPFPQRLLQLSQPLLQSLKCLLQSPDRLLQRIREYLQSLDRRVERFLEDLQRQPLPESLNFILQVIPIAQYPQGIQYPRGIQRLLVQSRPEARTTRLQVWPHSQLAARLFGVQDLEPMLDSLVFIAVCGIEIAIIGGLSGFHKGESTLAQRVWTMTWFGFGGFVGLFFAVLGLDPGLGLEKDRLTAAKCVLILGYCAPSVGGFIIVGQMLKEYGSCLIRLKGAIIRQYRHFGNSCLWPVRT